MDYSEIRNVAYNNVLDETKKHSEILGHLDNHNKSDYELSEYVLDVILDNPNIVFCVARYAVENVEYVLDETKYKFSASVETKFFTMKEFIEFIKEIKKRTLFGLFELFSYNANSIEIRFYKKDVPDRFNSIKYPIFYD